MSITRTSVGVAAVGLLTSSLLLASTPAQADIAPQEKDVVATGSDILQTAFNFIADGYGDLPGYNTAGNRYRFFNFDSSGDAQGRTAYIDPRLLSTTTVDGQKYVKQGDVKQLNPTVALRAGQPLVVRPSGGGGGGRDAIINDFLDTNGIGNWIDVGRSPDPVDASGDANQNLAQSKIGSKLLSVQFGTDRQVIAAASDTNAPASLSAADIRNIYEGNYRQWKDVPGYSGPAPDDTIIPLTLPSDAGMWNTFLNGVKTANKLDSWSTDKARSNPNSFDVQQNDPSAISGITDPAIRKNAIVPFPKSRYAIVNQGYYTLAPDGSSNANAYNGKYDGGLKRKAASASGIKLLAADSTGTQASDPYGTNFAVRAIFRESDLNSTTPWQPGSTLNWVKTLFYNPDPDGPTPFVNTPAGRALITAAGQTPTYHVFGTNNQEIDLGE